MRERDGIIVRECMDIYPTGSNVKRESRCVQGGESGEQQVRSDKHG